jgi:RNA-binding protein YlmH
MVLEEKDKKVFLAHIADLINNVIIRQQPQSTPFLDPAKQKRAEDLLKEHPNIRYSYFGGYPYAERKVMVIYPEYIDIHSLEIPFKRLSISWNKQYSKIKHRNILGSLLGLGIKREMMGDIILQNSTAYVFILKELASFVIHNLTRVGRFSVTIKDDSSNPLEYSGPATKSIYTTVASPRLDSIISSGFGISRTKALPHINRGNVSVNWILVTKSDFTVSQDDIVTVKGMGKIKVTEIGALTKSGRINIVIERFI